MRILALIVCVPAAVACKDDGGSGACSERGVYELLGAETADDGIPGFLVGWRSVEQPDAVAHELRDASGKVLRSATYDVPADDGTLVSSYFNQDGVLEQRETVTRNARGRPVSRLTELLDDDGKVIRTRSESREYDDRGNLVKTTTTRDGGETAVQTNTFDAEGRITREENVDPTYSFVLSYDYATNQVTEVNTEKGDEGEPDKTTETVSRYRSIEGGSPAVLLHRRETTSFRTTVLSLDCKDVGRRVDCAGNYEDEADGAFVGRYETSLALLRVRQCGRLTSTEELTLRELDVRATSTVDVSIDETVNREAESGGRERITTSRYVSNGFSRKMQRVTTFDATGQSPVETRTLDAGELTEVESWSY